jgi:hypothetical protein
VKLTPDEASGLTGQQVLELLIAQCAAEREECARIAEACGERLTQSGKTDEAMTALTIAAQIRARKP